VLHLPIQRLPDSKFRKFPLFLPDILKVKLTVSSEEELEAFKRKYGQNFVESLLKEMANHKWIETNAKMCPQCHIRVSVCSRFHNIVHRQKETWLGFCIMDNAG